MPRCTIKFKIHVSHLTRNNIISVPEIPPTLFDIPAGAKERIKQKLKIQYY
jgi:hypothetical protein